MMKKVLYVLLTLLYSINLFGQNDSILSVENKLIEHFKAYNFGDAVVTKDSLYFYSIDFNVSLSDYPIHFETKNRVIRNPYFSEKFDKSEEEEIYTKNFPRSFSVIYQNHLIALFENGKFVCIDLSSSDRNLDFEQQLNTKKFKYHWIIDDKLVAQSGNKKVFWDGEKWIRFKDKSPLKNRPILFDDSEFTVFQNCNGEWGGTIFFYEKLTGKIFFTESTCANTVTKTDKGYRVLAHLGHGSGFSEIKLIPNPRKLTQTKSGKIKTIVNGEAPGYTDQSEAYTRELYFFGLQIFSKFNYDQRELFIVYLAELTFIAEIKDNKIEIVHPLFFNDLYTHEPVTTQYGEYTLINIDNYGTGLYSEISILIIHENKITKIDWNEAH